MNALSASWFHYVYTIRFANCPWIHYLLRDFALNSLSASRMVYKFIICFSLNSLFVSQINLEITIFFCGITMNSLWNRYETTMKSIWIHFLLRDFSLSSLSFSRIHCEFTIYFENSLWIHYLFREFPMNSQSDSRFYYESTIFLRNHY